VPFLGVPVVRTLVEQLRSAGFDRIVANLHHRPETVRAALAGLPVAYSPEDPVLGTAGGLGRAVERGLLRLDEPVLVVNGKLHTDLDFAGVHHAHVTSDTAVSMVLLPNRARDAFREVHVERSRVVGFGDGREPRGPDPLLFCGVHVLSPSVLSALDPTPSDTVADVYPALIARGEIRADIRDARWWELSTPERYLGLHMRARRLEMPERPPVARIAADARVEDCVVWDGAEVGPGATLDRCILLPGARVPEGTHAACAVLEHSATADGLRRHALDPSLVARAAGS
jgi:NDP-sugar pyrophosphorylase family protein